MKRDDLPRLEDLPIPEEVRPDPSWSPLMLDMAAHIGAYRTLRILDRYGGSIIYVPRDPSKCPFADVVPDACDTIAQVFGGERLNLPVAGTPLRKARRAGVIAAVRAGKLTASAAQIICRTSRRYITQLLHESDEGTDAAPLVQLPRSTDPRQLDFPL